MSIENREYISSIDSSVLQANEMWIIEWKDDKNEILKTVQLKYPFTDQKIESFKPAISNYSSGDYDYQFKEWVKTINHYIRKIIFTASFNKIRRYLWKQYNCNSTTVYSYNRYPITYTAHSTGTNHLSNLLYSVRGSVSETYSFNSNTGMYTMGSATQSNSEIVFINELPAVAEGAFISKTYYWICNNGDLNSSYTRYYWNNGFKLVTQSNLSGGSYKSGYIIRVTNNYASGPYLLKINSTITSYNYRIGPVGEGTGGIVNFQYAGRVDWFGSEITKITNQVQSITTTNSSLYPSAGKHTDGYWYDYTGSTVNYSMGSFVKSFYTNSDTSYLNNQRNSDGYWYIKQ